jgi:hypothetical protein
MKQRVKWYEGTRTIAFGGMLFFHCFLPFQKRRENAKKCKKWQNEKHKKKKLIKNNKSQSFNLIGK